MLDAGEIDPFLDTTLMSPLGFSVYAEGKAKSLWNFIGLRDLPFRVHAPDLGFGLRYSWRSNMLRSTLESEGYWTSQRNPLVPILSGYLYHIDHTRSRGYLGSSLWVALWCARLLLMGDLKSVDVHKYDHLIRFLSKAQANGLECDLASLRMVHPIRPDPKPMLEICKGNTQITGNEARSPQLMVQSRNTGVSFCGYLTLLKLAQLCNAQHMFDDARWVIDWGYDLAPDLFSGRPPRDKYKEAKPGTSRKATQKELDAGVEVDEKGYVVDTLRVKQWYSPFTGTS